MNDSKAENTKEFETLDRLLSDSVDKEITCELDKYLIKVEEKSHALAISLKRCFEDARKSKRFLLVYDLGKKDAFDKKYIKEEELESYLMNHLKDNPSKSDFLHYREFVRLLRACTITCKGDVSSHIKGMYNNFFSGRRLIKAYELGREQG